STDVYVIANSLADSIILAQADTTGSATFYNGDDALLLINTATNDTIDIIGILGMDPGTNWPVDTGATSEFTLVRMDTVHEGTTDWALSATQWHVFPQNTFDYLGAHSMSPCTAGPPPPPPPDSTNCTTEIFFSEYIEGSSNNKALEIYNPMDIDVDLDNYEVHRFNNGASTGPDIFELAGILASTDVYVIANPSADTAIILQADTFGSATFYNGDDALLLINTATGDTVDIIGILGVDPGTNWPVDTGATSEYTLVRMPSVNEGTTDWALSSTQWIVFPQNTFDSLGAHTMYPCGPPPADPTVSFIPNITTVGEGDGTVSFSVSIMDPNASPTSVGVLFDAANSTATLGTDFTWTDDTVTFPAGSSAPISLDIVLIDDNDAEGDETIVMNLVNPTNNAIIGIGVFTMTVEDNDYAIYPIGILNDDADGDGLGDSLGVKCQIQGIVHGVDLQGTASTNLLFTVIDSTGGIAVFSGSDTSYTVTEGDEVIIRGTVGQFNGLTQFDGPDEIILVSQGNPTFDPLPVTALDETTESELVVLECVTIVDTSSFGGSGININVTNGVDTFVIRVDNNVDLYNGPAPTTKWLNIIGIGGQFDSSFPYNDGYQLLPRYVADVVEKSNPEVSFTEATASYDESDATAAATVSITNSNPDTTSVSIEIGSTGTATQGTDFALADTSFSVAGCGDETVSLPLGIVDDSDVEGDETIVLIITMVTNGTVSIDTLTVTITETDAIRDLLPSSAIKLYPNPGKVNIQWEATLNIEKMTISNLMGQEIISVANPEAHGQMNISHLPAGVYIIRMETKEGLWMQKWMKE
ncbi:MAG: T9SS type A sorting domain-containing protein, partial [Bacteroidetes bacterium]|nr:T9SS type A sorting domain-containing protein [Bacteroidota bacterium]